MYKTIERPADCELRSVIRFLNARNVRPSEIHRQICEVYGENVMTDGMVRKWIRMFNEGRENVHDEKRSGRPSLVNDDLVRKVDGKVREDRRFTISGLSLQFLEISRTLLYEIVRNHLDYRKLCSRWVPKMLTEEHKEKRVASALTFLTRYHEEGDEMLNHIVTGDETWVSHVTPESKQQSSQWKHIASPRVKKFKQTISTRKMMCTVFWDRQGVLLVEFMVRGTTINSAAYCETLKKLRREIQNKRRGMLSRGVLLLHDNALPHTAALTQNLITSFGWEQIDHPPYSPDLAPSDFHLFLHLKKFLAGQRFENDDDLKDAVKKWLTSQAAAFYEEGVQKLVPRYDKCLNNGGDYVEK